MELRLQVENVKCGGCARSIEKALRADARITHVEKGSDEGLRAAAATAKSSVSCAIGRMSDG